MPHFQKTIWVVNYDKLDDFVEKCVSVGASSVAIRTDNDLVKAIPAFHKKNISVFGWRWPSAKRDTAMREADKVAQLLKQEMDGYYVDPEGAKGQPYDWDQSGLEQLASDFCERIRSADPDKTFGVTSHYLGKKVFGKLPWSTYFKYANVFLPQAYWRSTQGVIGHGIPEDNFRMAQECWQKIGAPKEKIFPMAGELGVATASEIDAYVKEAARQEISSLHFYTFEESVKDSVWSAVAKA